MSVNRLMCSIQQTLYTGSIKQESLLYAGSIVPLRAVRKAWYEPPPEKKKKNSPQRHSRREQKRKEAEMEKFTHATRRKDGGAAGAAAFILTNITGVWCKCRGIEKTVAIFGVGADFSFLFL